MKSVSKICDEIRYHVNYYHKVKSSCSIDELLNIQDEISIRTLTLATYVGDWKTSYNSHYFIRRISVAKSSLQYQKQGLKQGQSDSQALVDNADQYEIEQAHEATAIQLDLFLRQTNIILDSLQQRISFMKQEKMVMRNQNQT
jgi:hypothetical protein